MEVHVEKDGGYKYHPLASLWGGSTLGFL